MNNPVIRKNRVPRLKNHPWQFLKVKNARDALCFDLFTKYLYWGVISFLILFAEDIPKLVARRHALSCGLKASLRILCSRSLPYPLGWRHSLSCVWRHSLSCGLEVSLLIYVLEAFLIFWAEGIPYHVGLKSFLIFRARGISSPLKFEWHSHTFGLKTFLIFWLEDIPYLVGYRHSLSHGLEAFLIL